MKKGIDKLKELLNNMTQEERDKVDYEANLLLLACMNTPPRTQKQIIEEAREERKRLGVKMLTPKMRAMSEKELLEYIKQRNLKNAKKHEKQQAKRNKENSN